MVVAAEGWMRKPVVVGSDPIRRCLILSSPLQRNDLAVLGPRAAAELGPCVHQPSSFLEHVAALVGGFDVAADNVRTKPALGVLECWYSCWYPAKACGKNRANYQ